MKLLRSINVSVDLNIETSESIKADLEIEAFRFLMAGGTLSLDNWQELTPLEREAFYRAGKKIKADAIAHTGIAAQGIEQALSVYAEVDGGDMQSAYSLIKTVAGAAQKVKSEHVAGS